MAGMDPAAIKRQLHQYFLELDSAVDKAATSSVWTRPSPEYTQHHQTIPIPPSRTRKDPGAPGVTARYPIGLEEAYCDYLDRSEVCDADANNPEDLEPGPRRNNPNLPVTGAFANALANIVIPNPGVHNRTPTLAESPATTDPNHYMRRVAEMAEASLADLPPRAQRNYLLVDATTHIHGSHNVATPDFAAVGSRLSSTVAEMVFGYRQQSQGPAQGGQAPPQPQSEGQPMQHTASGSGNGTDYGHHFSPHMFPQPTATPATPGGRAQASGRGQAQTATPASFGRPPPSELGPWRIELRCGLEIEGHGNIVGPNVLNGISLRTARARPPPTEHGLHGRNPGEGRSEGVFAGRAEDTLVPEAVPEVVPEAARENGQENVQVNVQDNPAETMQQDVQNNMQGSLEENVQNSEQGNIGANVQQNVGDTSDELVQEDAREYAQETVEENVEENTQADVPGKMQENGNKRGREEHGDDEGSKRTRTEL